MSNTLIIIGSLGHRRAFLNVSVEEAVKRFCETEAFEPSELFGSDMIEQIEFTDEFEVYDAWPVAGANSPRRVINHPPSRSKS